MRRARRIRRLSLTSLIDVIFLLLLFFMLTSTFTRFSEVELAGAGSAASADSQARPVFVQLGPDALRLDGQPLALAALPAALRDTDRAGTPVLVALSGPVTSQRLTDLLVTLRALPGLRVTVLGGDA